jgi:hypothetical protein
MPLRIGRQGQQGSMSEPMTLGNMRATACGRSRCRVGSAIIGDDSTFKDDPVATTRRRCKSCGHVPSKAWSRPQCKLGLMYANGQGVPQDYGVAASWFLVAAEQGDA